MNLSGTLLCFFALALLASAVPTHKRNSQGGPYGGPDSPDDGPGGPYGGPGGPYDGPGGPYGGPGGPYDGPGGPYGGPGGPPPGGPGGPYGGPGGPPPGGPGGSGMEGMGYAMGLIAKGCGPNAEKVEKAIRDVLESNILRSELFSMIIASNLESIPEPMITMVSCAISNIESLDDVAGLTGGVPVERIQSSYRLIVFLQRVFASGLEDYVENMGSEEQELADGFRSLLNVYYVAEELGLYDLEILEDGEN